jgi:hypothetical protein
MLALFMLVPINLTFAEPTTSITMLTGAAQQSDNQQVVFRGEVVGDLISSADGRVWVTMIDSGSAISVLMKPEDAALIDATGRYEQTGTKLEVTGIFHLSCPTDDGLSDVHATSVTVVAPGEPRKSSVNMMLLVAGLLLVVIGGLLAFLYHIFHERMR